jgi:hypothetical protein
VPLQAYFAYGSVSNSEKKSAYNTAPR